MGMTRESHKVLAALTGLSIDGGIASVSRSIVRALDEEVGSGRLNRLDKILLLDEVLPSVPAGDTSRTILAKSSTARFALYLSWLRLHGRGDLILFDHLGLGRALLPSAPLPLPRYAVFVHGLELTNAERGVRSSVLRKAWRLLANSQHTADRVATMLPETRERIRVVPLCVEPARVEKWESQGVLDSMQRRVPAAMIVGRMWSDQPGKGHDALIEAMPEVLEAIPDGKLWIVGQGDDAERLQRKAHGLGVSDSVVFHGRVSDEELSRLYRSAAVFAMPSQQEGFGLVYLEAMWHGLPCIGSTADAARHVIPDHAGRLIPYGDVSATAQALKVFLMNTSQSEMLGVAARQWVEERFSFERFKGELLRSLELG